MSALAREMKPSGNRATQIMDLIPTRHQAGKDEEEAGEEESIDASMYATEENFHSVGGFVVGSIAFPNRVSTPLSLQIACDSSNGVGSSEV